MQAGLDGLLNLKNTTKHALTALVLMPYIYGIFVSRLGYVAEQRTSRAPFEVACSSPGLAVTSFLNYFLLSRSVRAQIRA